MKGEMKRIVSRALSVGVSYYHVRLVCTALLALFHTTLSRVDAFGCDISSFGKHRTAPSAVMSPIVEDQFASFEWGTDAYTRNGYWWSWNFIRNDSDSKYLALYWRKGGITLPTVNPLPPSRVACRYRLLATESAATPILDEDAEILYSVSNQVQKAAVFVAPSPAVPNRLAQVEQKSSDKLEIVDSFQPPLGSISVEIGTGYKPTSGAVNEPSHFTLDIKFPSGITIAVSDLPGLLTKDQIAQIIQAFSEQGLEAFTGYFHEIAQYDADKQLNVPSSMVDDPVLVMRGRENASFNHESHANVRYDSLHDARVAQHEVYMAILGEKGLPLAGETVRVTVPDNR